MAASFKDATIDTNRINFIINAKSLGFSLTEIKQILALKNDPNGSAQQIRDCVSDKEKIIGDKIRLLQDMQKALQDLHLKCKLSGAMSTTQCPILRAFDANLNKQCKETYNLRFCQDSATA